MLDAIAAVLIRSMTLAAVFWSSAPLSAKEGW
jgi:hypothetical protein